jgi:transposase-like protein
MVLIPVLCPHCHSDHIIQGGKTKAGTQRYKCQNVDCPHYSLQLSSTSSTKAAGLRSKSTSSIWHSMAVVSGIPRGCHFPYLERVAE